VAIPRPNRIASIAAWAVSSFLPILLAAVIYLGPTGCGGPSPPQADYSALDPGVTARDPEAAAALQEAVSKAVNDTTIAYAPLRYRYNEDLLDKLDHIEAYFAGRPVPRRLAS